MIGEGKNSNLTGHFFCFLLLSCFFYVLIAELLHILTWMNFVMYTGEYIPFIALIV